MSRQPVALSCVSRQIADYSLQGYGSMQLMYRRTKVQYTIGIILYDAMHYILHPPTQLINWLPFSTGARGRP